MKRKYTVMKLGRFKIKVVKRKNNTVFLMISEAPEKKKKKEG